MCTHELRKCHRLRGSLVVSYPNCGPFCFTMIGTECKTDDSKVSCASRCVEGYRLLLWQQKDRNKYTNCCSRSFNTARCASVLRIGTSGLNTALAITSHPSSALCSSLATSLNAVTHLRPSNEAF